MRSASPSATIPAGPAAVTLTRDVARQLDTTANYLQYLIRARRMAEPARDSTGRYVWAAEDIEAARQAMRTDGRTRQARARKREEAGHAEA